MTFYTIIRLKLKRLYINWQKIGTVAPSYLRHSAEIKPHSFALFEKFEKALFEHMETVVIILLFIHLI